MTDAERVRLRDTDAGWKRWGPYLSERAWGTVREDYGAECDPWTYFPHDHARSRTFRWSEDGLGGICDEDQRLCLAFAFWNGVDPILKERIFGLTGHEGNHGEDAKEYWWYLDSTPTHSFMKWAYVYPQAAFPYEALVGHGRSRLEPELELVDTGILDDKRYWDVVVEYAKAAPADWCIRLTARNAGPDEATLHVLPTLWFRNTWSWGQPLRRPVINARDGMLVADHQRLGTMTLAGDGDPDLLFCENETNTRRLYGVEGPAYPKDGINDHVVSGAPTVNPARTGTKAALHYRVTVAPGASASIELRFCPDAEPEIPVEEVLYERRREADEFYSALLPAGDPEGSSIARQAFAGMMWGKQFYHFDVDRWLDGDPGFPPPPESRLHRRNSEWRDLFNHDVISMPDPWEYPWYAAWDLAFHAVAIAHIDPQFAKEQLILMCREWYMHANGQLPAYEWEFGDVNPPVHAWAALRVFLLDGGTDTAFLERIFHKLMLNFTWWVNKKDIDGNNIFEGGFLGLDNIGPLDRSGNIPGHLEQSDGTAWMGMYALNMLEIALRLAATDPVYEDVATKFFEHFAHIAFALEMLWDDVDGFHHDVLHLPDGERRPVRVRSMVGLLPMVGMATINSAILDDLPEFASRMRWFLKNRPVLATNAGHIAENEGTQRRLFAMVSPERLQRILSVMLDEQQFLSPHGVRALSAGHRGMPFAFVVDGIEYTLDYTPGESTSPLFGGNSNWRGPVWFPVNLLLIEALRRYHLYLGASASVELPTGSGNMVHLDAVADEISDRLIGIFRRGADGRRPVNGASGVFPDDEAWRDRVMFYEYFHGDTGAGLGASHQTGWTGLVADLLLRHS